MYLKALEIQGFKSFPDKTVLTFGQDITAIVGPNGSGKSNISDAIRWVMGEQSTRALRGGKMEDVIFGGTERRRQQGFAEVTLVLDNSGHFFDLEQSEVMVTRRYYRSGESEYYINRRSVRLKDINELFMDTGLGREGYSIIGQGKIDEILSVKSADRREVFEEAAGISRFRHRKEEAEHKLERTDENLLRIGDKIDELALQVEPLRGQSEKAQKFLICRDELRGLEISLWLEQLEQIRMGGRKVLSDYENAVRQREEARTTLDTLYASAEDYAAQMREKDMEADRVRLQTASLEADANECERTAMVLKNKIQNNTENAQRIRRELEQQEGRADSIGEQIAGRQERLERIAEQHAALTKKLAEKNDAAREAFRSAGTLEKELETLRAKEAVENASASEARALLSALAAAAQELSERGEGVQKSLAAAEERLAEAGAACEGTRSELTGAKEDRDSLLNVIGGYRLRLASRQKKLTAAEEVQVKLQMEENALRSRIHMLTEMEKLYEGYSRAVKLVMGEAGRGSLRGIHGPVAGLLRVPDSYAVAVEIALGGAMQHIVVDTEENGKAAIHSLKRRDGGRATFLPLSSIRPGELREKGLEGEPGFIGVASTLIEYDRQYTSVFSNLLGRVAIAQDMDAAVAIARKYGYRFRIVTLDGQVLNPGGSMTGGSVSRNAGILSRANELEHLNAQMQTLKDDLAAAAKTLEEVRRETAAASYELETAQGQQREIEDTILTLTGRLDSQEGSIVQLTAQTGSLRDELGQIGRRAAQVRADTSAARERIKALEGSAAAMRAETEGKARGQSELRTRMDTVGQEIAALNVDLAAMEAEKGTLEQTLRELLALRRDLEGDRSQQMDALARFETESRTLSNQVLDWETKLEEIQGKSRTQADMIRRLGEEKLELEAMRNRVDRESRDKNGELLALEREVSALEQKKAAAAMEERQILDKLWDTYALSHEGAQAQRMQIESAAKAARRIAELKRIIAGLGNINLDAIEEFRRVNERYTYLTQQRDDVEESKRELERIIAEITGEMRAIFAREFKTINEAFGETFRELFGGGRATLELEDENDILSCGIEIKVQPPGKTLKIISLLSGGEKAFVAIALYFAILKVRPTPFCVMDEIEAALDDANVVRFARYLRGISDKTQFIIITHRRGTMEEADVLYGVTMQEQGISRMLTINLNDVEHELHIK